MASIFVSICSFRDPLVAATIRNMMQQESGKHQIVYGIFEQTCEENSLIATANDLVNSPRVRYKRIDPQYADSAGWARHINALQFQNEDFYYQTDSHMIFDQNWDEFLVNDYETCRDKYSTDKIIITAGCKGFDLENGVVKKLNEEFGVSSEVKFYGFTDDGEPLYYAHFTNSTEDYLPAKYVLAGNFLAPKRFLDDVEISARAAFRFEQISLTLRTYAAGYMLLHSKEIKAYHYIRTQIYPTKHFIQSVQSKERMAVIHDGDRSQYLNLLSTIPASTLESYKHYAGVDVANRLIRRDSFGDSFKPLCNEITWKVVDSL